MNKTKIFYVVKFLFRIYNIIKRDYKAKAFCKAEFALCGEMGIIMANEAINFKIVPSVVRANEETTLKIYSYNARFLFFDDVTYNIVFTPKEESDVAQDEFVTLSGRSKMREIHKVKPKNGVIEIRRRFFGEQEWSIHISADIEEYKKYQPPIYDALKAGWGGLINVPSRGFTLSVYSLLPDLYERNVKKCDFHSHTNWSDGAESPERTAANYRKRGFDFLSMTDHNVYNSSRYVSEKLKFVKNYKIVCGEEVQNGYPGLIHMVNVGSRYSVNEIFLNEPTRVENEIAELAKSTAIPGGVDKKEYLYRVWIYREIKKSGGYAIFPHPFWTIKEQYHTETKMCAAIFENKLCDAFEIMGGCSSDENNLQHLFYYNMRLKGVNMPVVGSSDSHSSLPGADWFDEMFTILFEGGDGVFSAVNDGFAVAVERLKNSPARVYGDFRIAKYVHFLLKNYYPRQDELFAASGMLIERYLVYGEDTRNLILQIEEKIENVKKEFFGR